MDKEQLDEIRALGALFYTPEQVAQVIGFDPDIFNVAVSDHESLMGQAYWAGWYESDIPLRKGIMDLAKRGSSPAQTLALRMQEQAESRRYYEH